MKYTMTSPCDNCPFRRKGFIPLKSTRADQIAQLMLITAGGAGGEFPCHKTTVDCEDEDGFSDLRETKDSLHCAGALIFAEKQGSATQMMRIAERLGMYDAKALMENNPAVDEVFDTVDEMVEAHQEMEDGRTLSRRVRTRRRRR